MSMIGSNILQEITSTKRDSEMRDGIDLALCACGRPGTGTIQRGQVTAPLCCGRAAGRAAPDQVSIGRTGPTQQFNQHEIVLQPGNMRFAATDGWVDSVNPTRDKFGSHRLKEMLSMGAHLPLAALQSLFERTLADFAQAPPPTRRPPTGRGQAITPAICQITFALRS
jgi:hypothetical protein